MNFDDTDLQDTVDFVANKAPMASYFAVNAMFKPLTDGESNVIENVVVDAERLAQVVCAAAFDQARERQARLEYAPVPAAKPDGVPKLTAEMKAAAEAGTRRYEHFMKLFVDGDFCDPDATSYYEKPRKTRENDKSAGSGDTCAGAKGEGEAMTTQLSFWPDDKPSMSKNFEEGCLLKVTLSGEYSDHLAEVIGPGPVRLVRMEITGLTASVDKKLVFVPWQHIGLVQKEEEK